MAREGAKVETMNSELTPFLAILGAGALLAALIYAIVKTLSYSRDEYDYPVLLNRTNGFYALALVVAASAFLAVPPSGASVTYVAVVMAAIVAPVVLAIIRNVRATSLLFGLWISLLQMALLSIILIVMFLAFGARREQRSSR